MAPSPDVVGVGARTGVAQVRALASASPAWVRDALAVCLSPPPEGRGPPPGSGADCPYEVCACFLSFFAFPCALAGLLMSMAWISSVSVPVPGGQVCGFSHSLLHIFMEKPALTLRHAGV
ncbi:hypothetical protein ILYODFUR_015308 [Ilyodon furcidens]|uniref:Uncharacterized protein n=1 Tax=Ilyodon furcidens TaxID=33524 RepID=A0ABV0SYX1_9TELE